MGEHYSDLVWEEFCHLAWLRIKATVNDSVREQAIRDEGNGSW